MIKTMMGLFVWVCACQPKATDTSTLGDLNPCAEGEILASNGDCVDARAGQDTGG